MDDTTALLTPAQLQVVISRLTGVAEEMSVVLQRSAFSPNIKERADHSAALFTATGELLVQAENIPVHLGSMPASVAAVIERFGGSLVPGDRFIVNDPFAGGTHLNDITVVAPCLVAGTRGAVDASGDRAGDGAAGEGAGLDGGPRLVGWAATRAHHADVGGAAPGSMPADATEIFEEGLRIPPVRLTDEVVALLLANSRTPGERRGDLDAQVGACELGVRRLAEIDAEYHDGPGHPGNGGSAAVIGEVVAYGERRMRAALAEIPDGTWTVTDQLDSTGAGAEHRAPSPITVTVTVAGDTMTVDFAGSAPQSDGSVNAVAAVTASAVAYAVRAVVDPTLPANGGTLRPLSLVLPAGSIVAAEPPAAVGAGNVEVSQRVADVVLAALAQATPDRAGAGDQGTMNNLLIGGRSPDGEAWVYYETIGGGQGGAAPARDDHAAPAPGESGIHTGMTNTGHDYRTGTPLPGQSGIHTGMTNTRNTPIEALERAFPLRVLRYRLRRGSGGAGSAPGGEGIERDLQVLEDVTVSLITERRVSRPWGLVGGEPGAPGENWLLLGGDEEHAERLPDKCTVRLRGGDVLRMLTPGGGGWGDPTWSRSGS